MVESSRAYQLDAVEVKIDFLAHHLAQRDLHDPPMGDGAFSHSSYLHHEELIYEKLNYVAATPQDYYHIVQKLEELSSRPIPNDAHMETILSIIQELLP